MEYEIEFKEGRMEDEKRTGQTPLWKQATLGTEEGLQFAVF